MRTMSRLYLGCTITRVAIQSCVLVNSVYVHVNYSFSETKELALNSLANGSSLRSLAQAIRTPPEPVLSHV